MTYVVDTNSFSVLKNYYPNSFPSLWQNLDQLANDGTLLSVREVLNELQNDNRVTFVQEWARRHRAIFATPTREELIAVQQILAIPHFQAVISEKALLRGTPVADPFIVASAQVNGGVVVTEEAHRPNAAKIPNICERLDVECHNLEWLMQQEGWSF
jgi:hypothetical protein